MLSSISNSTQGTTDNVSSQSLIAQILARIKGLRKQLTALQKQLKESTDPAEQKLLMKQIQDLQQVIDMAEAQIAQIQANDQRKAAMREHARLAHIAEEREKQKKD
jgi:predicted  nucleic acid-binding Zn-ribbon protein